MKLVILPRVEALLGATLVTLNLPGKSSLEGGTGGIQGGPGCGGEGQGGAQDHLHLGEANSL